MDGGEKKRKMSSLNQLLAEYSAMEDAIKIQAKQVSEARKEKKALGERIVDAMQKQGLFEITYEDKSYTVHRVLKS